MLRERKALSGAQLAHAALALVAQRGQLTAGVAGAGLGAGRSQCLVVPRGERHCIGAHAVRVRETLDRVFAFGGINAMEADLRLRASRTLRIVVEDDDGVTRLRAALLLLVVALLVLDAERQAFLGQQAHHERVVGFAVLAANRSFGARLCGRNLVMRGGVFAEDVFDDLERGLVLVDEAVAACAQAPRNRATRVACRRLAPGAA
ncbi:hypothetical protein DL770_011189 [Monosporascus sp. CRB-9-2]|nr:hypothetical protein DL770_011189 [Monosporascus sp. CRB-9-2]